MGLGAVIDCELPGDGLGNDVVLAPSRKAFFSGVSSTGSKSKPLWVNTVPPKITRDGPVVIRGTSFRSTKEKGVVSRARTEREEGLVVGLVPVAKGKVFPGVLCHLGNDTSLV